MSRKFRWRDGLATVRIVAACVNETSVTRSASRIVNGRRTSESNIEKTEALAPNPNASVRTTMRAERRAFQDAAAGIARFESEGSHEGVSRRRVKDGPGRESQSRGQAVNRDGSPAAALEEAAAGQTQRIA